MNKPISYLALTLAGAGVLLSPAKAAEPTQVSGTSIHSQVEAHFIPSGGDPTRGFTVEKFVGAVTSPGWFDSVQETGVGVAQVDLRQGQGDIKGSLFWRGTDGTATGSYIGKVAFAIDPQTNASKGTAEGAWEFFGGTGRFANVRGHGTFKSEFNAGNDTVHWILAR